MLLARMADAVYWAGRYLERAEDTARIVAVHGESHFDLPVGEDVGWRPLLAIFGLEDRFEEWLRVPTGRVLPGPADSLEAQIVRFLVSERDNPSSVVSSLRSARDNLRSAQPVVPRQAWEVGSELWRVLQPERPDAYPLDGSGRAGRVRVLRAVVDGCQRMNGVLWGQMRRDEALAFLRIGQQLERVDITARVLAVRADSLVPASGDDPYAEVRRMGVLRSLAADQPYRRATPASAGAASTLRFLLQDSRFPRAAAACLSDILHLLKGLPRNEQAVAACSDGAVLVADAAVGRLDADDLRHVALGLRRAVAILHDDIESTFFRAASAEPFDEQDRVRRVGPAAGRGPNAPGERTAASGSAWDELASGRIDAVRGSRIYRVTHRTTYEYEGPVEQAYNEAHLRPRDTACQRCREHRIEVVPEPSSWSGSLDQFANEVTCFVVQGRFDRLVVTATSEVMVQPAVHPPAGPSWEAARRVLEADRLPASRDARRFRSPSRLVPSTPALADYAAASFVPNRPLVEAAVDLCGRIHRDFEYDPGFTSVTTPLAEVLAHRRGVCQDFAHLAVGCLRSIGLAARYVSGYIETVAPPGAPRLVGADASHAWASVFLPGWGWFDIDPTNDQVAVDRYITTAWGRDFWDVSPLRGSIEGGGRSHALDVAVDVELLEGADAAS